MKLWSMSTGILKREWAVRPPGSIEAATPELAVAKAMNPFVLTAANKARYKNVFPVPPGPSMKKAPDLLEYTLSRIMLYVLFCSTFNLLYRSISSSDTIIFLLPH